MRIAEMRTEKRVWLLGVWITLMAQGGFAQECNDAVRATAPDSRYTDHGNGTVTDRVTGLIWKKCSQGLTGSDCLTGAATKYSWQAALEEAESENYASYSDWRLPNIKELASLVERRCNRPAINETVFPATKSSNYWSSSPSADYSGGAWYLYFRYGSDGDYFKSNDFYVRLVRGGQ
jgi:hypothetical protein